MFAAAGLISTGTQLIAMEGQQPSGLYQWIQGKYAAAQAPAEGARPQAPAAQPQAQGAPAARPQAERAPGARKAHWGKGRRKGKEGHMRKHGTCAKGGCKAKHGERHAGTK